MYNTMFAAGLRLPLTELHRQLVNFLGLSVSQIAPNCLENLHRTELHRQLANFLGYFRRVLLVSQSPTYLLF